MKKLLTTAAFVAIATLAVAPAAQAQSATRVYKLCLMEDPQCAEILSATYPAALKRAKALLPEEKTLGRCPKGNELTMYGLV